MGGIDTFRGAAFQAAYSVSLAFDVLGGEGDVLQVEGDKDVVDAALSDIDDVVLRSVQAKTKQEPYTWKPGEVAQVIKSWLMGMQLAPTMPDMTTIDCETDCGEELQQMAMALSECASWGNFAEISKDLDENDVAGLTETGKAFAAAVKDEVVKEEAGDLLFAQYQYRSAVLEELVEAAQGRAKEYLLAFEGIDRLMAIVAGLIETLVITDHLRTIEPDRLDLSGGGEVSRINVKVSPDPLVLDPGRVVRVAGDSIPEGLVLIEGLNHSFSFGENEDSSAEINGRFIAL